MVLRIVVGAMTVTESRTVVVAFGLYLVVVRVLVRTFRTVWVLAVVTGGRAMVLVVFCVPGRVGVSVAFFVIRVV